MMIGVPGRSDAARTSSESWVSALRRVKVPAGAGVRSHWARVEEQSADNSLTKVGLSNPAASSPRRKQAFCALNTYLPADGSVQGSSRVVVASGLSSATTASIGDVPQPASNNAQITPRGEVFSAVGFWSRQAVMCWLRASTVMSFASLARVRIVVPSSFAALVDALRSLLAARSYWRALTMNGASA
jgi:hypothetical protein